MSYSTNSNGNNNDEDDDLDFDSFVASTQSCSNKLSSRRIRLHTNSESESASYSSSRGKASPDDSKSSSRRGVCRSQWSLPSSPESKSSKSSMTSSRSSRGGFKHHRKKFSSSSRRAGADTAATGGRSSLLSSQQSASSSSSTVSSLAARGTNSSVSASDAASVSRSSTSNSKASSTSSSKTSSQKSRIRSPRKTGDGPSLSQHSTQSNSQAERAGGASSPNSIASSKSSGSQTLSSSTSTLSSKQPLSLSQNSSTSRSSGNSCSSLKSPPRNVAAASPANSPSNANHLPPSSSSQEDGPPDDNTGKCSSTTAGLLPRTKKQRLRLLQASQQLSQESTLSSQESTTDSLSQSSPSRKVRFALAAAAAGNNKGRRRPPRAAKQPSRATKKSDGWLESLTASAASGASTQKLPSVPEHAAVRPHEQQQQQLHKSTASASNNNTDRAELKLQRQPRRLKKTDIYAVQDAGNYQMLKDECLFLCSSIVSAHQLDAAADLLLMLANKQNRRTLLTSGEEHFESDEFPLQAILGVFAWAKSLVENNRGLPASRTTDNNDDDDGTTASVQGRTKAARQRQQQHESQHLDAVPYSPALSFASATGTATNSNVVGNDSTTNRGQLLDAIGMIAYLISLDCTMSADAACAMGTGASKAARRLRRAILLNQECLQGILYMVLADPLTQRMRGETPTRVRQGAGDLVGFSPVSSVQFSKVTTGSTKQETSSAASTPLGSPVACGAAAVGGTPDSQASTRSEDPTAAGRLRRKRRRLEQQQAQQYDTLAAPENDNGQANLFSFTSDSPEKRSAFGGSRQKANRKADDNSSLASSTESHASHTIKATDKLDQVTARIVGSMIASQEDNGTSRTGAAFHACGKTDGNAILISSSVPLVAISRIISGRFEGSDESCIDDDLGHEEDTHGDVDLDGKSSGDDDYNPILWTNRILGENGAIPLLSQALAEALVAVTYQLKQTKGKTGIRECQGCLWPLQDRVAKLVSLVDGASLLSESNRQLFCEEGFTSESGGCLTVGLIAVLEMLVGEQDSPILLFEGVWGEITLAVLRMLTSLTHENKTAAKELELGIGNGSGHNSPISTTVSRCGLDVVAEVLRAAVRYRKPDGTGDNKLVYDSVVFCLNMLANAVESGGSCRKLAEMTIPSYDGENKLFLTWLTRWLVDQTQTFREAVVESTFGSSPTKHTERKLDVHEDENLVTAGNGFVLLSCLLVDEKHDEESNDSSAYKLILAELPGADRDSKMGFLKNTLKAFCNFYHYSIGDLSVAVVAPVKQLIKRLETIQEQQRRLSLGYQ